MKWIRRLLVLFSVLVFALVGYVAVFALVGFTAEYPFRQQGLAVPGGGLLGAYHVHSLASDGRASVEDIAQAAKRAGLSFVVVTDHNVEVMPPPRFEDGVLLMYGTELSTPFGHLVVLGLPRAPGRAERQVEPVEAAARVGGLTFLAHPVQKRQPWTALEQAPAATGLELYSGDTMLRQAQEAPFTRLLPAAGAYLTNPAHAMLSLVQEQPETTERLLELSSGKPQPKVALCAHDAHGVPPYDETFQTMAMLLPRGEEETPFERRDAQEAATYVLARLTRGEAYCVFRALGDGSGFAIEGLESGARRARVGSKLKVVLPEGTPAEVRLRVTGPGKVEPDGRTVHLEGEGAIQVEVWRRAPGRFFESEWKPWIVPSPIVVRP